MTNKIAKIEDIVEYLKVDPWLDEAAEKFEFEIIDVSFEEGGRWSNWEISILELGDKFYSLTREVPGSETQSGQPRFHQVREVTQKPIQAFEYKSIEDGYQESWTQD